jgi:hypothetical protein
MHRKQKWHNYDYEWHVHSYSDKSGWVEGTVNHDGEQN